MSRWKTSYVVGTCLTCNWASEERDKPRVAAQEAVQHKRKNPDHDVFVDREQGRRIELRDRP